MRIGIGIGDAAGVALVGEGAAVGDAAAVVGRPRPLLLGCRS